MSTLSFKVPVSLEEKKQGRGGLICMNYARENVRIRIKKIVRAFICKLTFPLNNFKVYIYIYLYVHIDMY